MRARTTLAIYRNQFLLIVGTTSRPLGLIEPVRLGPLTFFAGPALQWHSTRCADRQILLIGEAFDPASPDASNQDIADALLDASSSSGALLRAVQGLAGRHVILYSDDVCSIAVADAAGQRQIYFGESESGLCLTSSPKMFFDCFDLKLQIAAETKQLLESKIFDRNEHSWFGDEYIDPRLRKVLPNHFLDLRSASTKRLDLLSPDVTGKDQVLTYGSTVLRSTFHAMARRRPLIQALTAGWDSRVLLAASRQQVDRISYFVFDNTGHSPSDDARVATQVARRLHLRFERIERPALRDDFLVKFKREHLVPRVMYTTAHIQHFCDLYKGHPSIFKINGNTAEIIRCYYGTGFKNISLKMLTTFSGYGDTYPRFTRSISRWMDEAIPFAQSRGISLLDLFEWEQSTGNWAAAAFHELDQSVETISPFNHRGLLLAILSLPARLRSGQDNAVFRELCERLWPAVLSEPVNPHQQRLATWARSCTPLHYAIKSLRIRCGL